MKRSMIAVVIMTALTATSAHSQTYVLRAVLPIPATETVAPAPSPPPAPTWTPCAVENGYCRATGTVRYGVGASWIQRTVARDGIACSNDAFGNDPAYGTVKSCQVLS